MILLSVQSMPVAKIAEVMFTSDDRTAAPGPGRIAPGPTGSSPSPPAGGQTLQWAGPTEPSVPDTVTAAPGSGTPE